MLRFALQSSDNEDHTYEDFDDYSDNDEIIIDDDDDIQITEPERQAPPPPAPPARTTRQSTSNNNNPTPPLQGYIPPGAFQAGFGGNAFARPPASMFRRGYRAFSTAILEVQQGRGHLGGGSGRSNLMYGGKSKQ